MTNKPFIGDIEKLTEENDNFRKVLSTHQHTQLVVMSLLPGEDIGEEIHETTDQFIRVEDGEGKAIIDGEEHAIKSDWAIIIPAGSKHNLINTSTDKKMKLYTLYSPAHHKTDCIHQTKEEAESDTTDHI